MTANVIVTPVGYSPVTYQATISGSNISIDHTVSYDVVHSGSIQLVYGSTSKTYTWASDTLTTSNIYTFPSSFTYSGLANGYYGGAHLKAATSGSLVLTFSGGDMLFSSVIASQVSYVKYTQGSSQTTVTGAVCSDPLETVTFTITPAVKEALTLQVKLIGPDGTLGTELTNTVPVGQFESEPNAVATTAGLQLWLDGSDPLGTGSVPSSNASVTTWFDKSGYGRHAVQQNATSHSSKFHAKAKNELGAILFYTDTWRDNTQSATTNLQRYVSPMTFPNSAYTIFAVFSGEVGQVASGSGAFNFGLGLSYAGLMTAVKSGAAGSWTTNLPDWTTNKRFNIRSQWTLVTMVVNGSSCTPYVNGNQMTVVEGPTTAFNNVVVGGWSSAANSKSDYFIGDLGELAIYSGALDLTAMWQVHRTLGKKWGLWPYSLSPLWNVVEYTSGDGFGKQFDNVFEGGGSNWGTSIYWEWFQSQFDLTLLAQGGQYETLPGVHINMAHSAATYPYGSMSYVLNNPLANTFYPDVRPATDAEWAMRWGYQQGQRPTHVALRTNGGTSSAAVYKVTGFASAAFTSGTLLATLDGTRFGTSSYIWTALTVVGKYTHFELRQVTGPFDGGAARGVLLGRSSTADTSGCGSVARANLKCWLDGSDPHATGEAPVDGTVVVKMNDKSGTGRYAYPYATNPSENSVQFCGASSTSTLCGATRMPRQWGMVGYPAGYTPHMRINFLHTAWPSAYTVCIAAKLSRAATTGNWWLVSDGDPMFQIAVYNNTLQFTNNSTLNPLSQMNTKKADGSYVVPNAGEWMFLCLVSTSSSSIPYYNGTRLPSINTAPSVDTSRTWVQLFGHNGGNFLSYGDLGEFAFYDRALTDNEISTLRGTIATKFGVTLTPI